MLRTDQWTLLGSLSYGHLHVYVLPPGFDKEDFGRLFSFQEIGNDNFMTPNGMRQWYETTPNSSETSLPNFLIQVSWDRSSLEGLSKQVKWRQEGYGCAVVDISQREIHQHNILVRLFNGPFIVAETILPALGKIRQTIDRWMDDVQIDSRAWLVSYQTGGGHLVSSSDVFQRIFASYAREDIEVVKSVESILNVTGMLEFRWDLKILQAGDHWEEKLLKEIEEADSFQLFWSECAKASKNVRKEWTYALELNREHFVRPVYWKDPLPKPPKKLSHIHFSRIRLKT